MEALPRDSRTTLLTTLILGLATLNHVTSSPITPSTSYSVVVDAGSSGSRIYVYRYDENANFPKLTHVQKNGENWNYKIRPGISTLAGKLGEVPAYVAQLIDQLKADLDDSLFPRSVWEETPFMWFATAGMRLLDDVTANALTNKIREVARDKSKVPFKFEDTWARTLSGEEEGAFAWISLNYNNKFFEGGVEDYGVVETGGASMQMTFMADGDILSNKFNVIIDQKLYPLYTHSYLYFGQDQFIKRVLRSECLCRRGKDADCQPCVKNGALINPEVTSSCLLKGDRRNETISVDGVDFRITLKGATNVTRCTRVIEDLFREEYDCFTKPCAFAGIYQPAFGPKKKFYGSSAIRYAATGLGIPLGDTTWAKLRNAALKYCQYDSSTLSADDKYAWARCLIGIFMAKQLEELQFPADQNITIADADTWTVGAVLYQHQLMEILMEGNASTNLTYPSTLLLLICFLTTLTNTKL